MALAQAGARDTNEARLFLKRLDVGSAHVTHRRLEAPGKLVQYACNRALVGNLALDTFRHQLQRVANLRLEVAVRRTACHGAHRTHAAIRLEGAPLVQIDL